MSRSVYADPFGAYTKGYDVGQQRETALQQGIRTARDSDWNFYNMKPLELQTAQRNNSFETYADPFKRQLLPIGVDNARTTQFMNRYNADAPLAFLGMPGPLVDAMAAYTGYGVTGDPNTGYQFTNPQTGQQASPTLSPTDLIGQYDAYRQERQKNAETRYNQEYQNALLPYEALGKNAYAQQVANTTSHTGQVPLQAWMGTWFGGGMPGVPPTPVPTAMPPPNTAAPAPAPIPAAAAASALAQVATPEQIAAARAKYPGASDQDLLNAWYATGGSTMQQPNTLPPAYTPPTLGGTP